eukprot:TRINITY_DN8373_c0_g1_i2.p1 TRINITY_DN8373_c0_g1~~TRINITY_DN8373_c0_g1_i2.p1  ORF type:complete len:1362 (+),score=367.48 TRINITY_DN8373_c0_g1_i2:112-4197(+)
MPVPALGRKRLPPAGDDGVTFEGWLKKKSHHLGFWRWRYVRVEDQRLLYWALPGVQGDRGAEAAEAAAAAETPRASPRGGIGGGGGALGGGSSASTAGVQNEARSRGGAAPRGQIDLRHCHAVAAGDCRLALRTSSEQRFDEEFQAKSSHERDEWICILNGAALRHRVSAVPSAVSDTSEAAKALTEGFLRGRGLWNDLCKAAHSTHSRASSSSLEACGVGASWRTQESDLQAKILARARAGPALLRLPWEGAVPWRPRQGCFVQLGRQLLRRGGCPGRAGDSATARGAASTETAPLGAPDCEGPAEIQSVWLLLISDRPLPQVPARRPRAASCSPTALAAAAAAARAPASAVADAASAASAAAESADLELNTLVMYASRDGPELIRVALRNCSPVGAPALANDGCGVELVVEERLDEAAISDGETSAEKSNMEESDLKRRWTLVFGSVTECENWRRALDSARMAGGSPLRAEMQSSARGGFVASCEESLAGFDEDPASWCSEVARRLRQVDGVAAAAGTVAEDVSGRAFGVPAPTMKSDVALRVVMATCEEVCREAEAVLAATLQRRPLRRTVCDAIAGAALAPALDALRNFWRAWKPVLSQRECRTLLKWLSNHLLALHKIGVVYEPWRGAIEEMAAEIALGTGTRLRRMVLQLLVRTLSAEVFTPTEGEAKKGVNASLAEMFPLDFFTIVHTCFPEDPENEMHASGKLLHACTQRVAKYLIFEAQESLWAWLLASRAEQMRILRSCMAALTTPTARNQELLPRTTQWLCLVAGLAGAAPALAQRSAAFATVVEQNSEDSSACLGSQALPAEWSFGAEAGRWEALCNGFLWALCDVATLRWRRQAFGVGSRLLTASRLVTSLPKLLSEPLQLLRARLDLPLCGRLFTKVVEVILATYIIHVSDSSGQPNNLREDAKEMYRFFGDIAPAGTVAKTWSAGEVYDMLRAVLQRDHGENPGRCLRGLDASILGKLVNELSDSPLDLMTLLGAQDAAALTSSFIELPGPLPLGGLFRTQPVAEEMVMHSQSWYSASGSSLAEPVGASLSATTCCGDRTTGTARPAVQARRRSSWPPASPESAENERRWPRRTSTAAEGGLCDLRVEDLGAQGCFCDVATSLASECDLDDIDALGVESFPAIQNAEFDSGMVACGDADGNLAASATRRRWVELVRDDAQVAPCLVFFSEQQRALGGEALSAWSFDALISLTFRGTLGLGFVFRDADPVEGEPGARRFELRFDCPSHALRWRVVLEAWWAREDLPRGREPLIALGSGGAAAAKTTAFAPAGDARLSSRALRQALGGLWTDVQGAGGGFAGAVSRRGSVSSVASTPPAPSSPARAVAVVSSSASAGEAWSSLAMLPL